MRKYNEEEKSIIRTLVVHHNSGCSTVASIVYNSIIKKEIEQYRKACEEAEVNCDWELYEEQRIIEITFFLNWLENNRYIYFLPIRYPKIGKGENFCQEVKFLDLPENTKKLFEKYVDSELFVSSELKNLVQNDFKNYEDFALEEAKKQTNRSTITMIISAVTFLLSLISIINK